MPSSATRRCTISAVPKPSRRSTPRCSRRCGPVDSSSMPSSSRRCTGKASQASCRWSVICSCSRKEALPTCTRSSCSANTRASWRARQAEAAPSQRKKGAAAPFFPSSLSDLLAGVVDDRRLRSVVRGNVLDVLRGEWRSHAGHDRVLAQSRLVIAQRLGEIVRILPAELRIIGHLAVAIQAVTCRANLLRLLLTGRDVGGKAGRGGKCANDEACEKCLHGCACLHFFAVCTPWPP